MEVKTIKTNSMKAIYTFLILLLFLLTSQPLSAQKAILPLLDSNEVPFEMVKNAIVIPVTINGKTYRFVLDTGGLFSIDEKILKENGFPVTDSILISDINSNERFFKKASIPKISIGALDFIDQQAIVTFDSDTYPNSCFGTDGMIGRDFFEGMLLHFDYEKKIMRLTNDASSFQLDDQHQTKLKISKRGLPDVLLKINGKKEYIEFDSGSGDFFSYQFKTAEKLKVKENSDKLLFKGIFSFGVSSKEIKSTSRYKVKIDQFQIGATAFKDFYSDFTKSTAPRIGAGILYYGKVTVDYQNLGFYFEPYQDRKELPKYTSFGFDIVFLNGEYLIKWILEGSPAEKFGLQYGLKIKAINNIPIEQVAMECEGYINGYSFYKEEKIELEYFNAENKLQKVTLEKQHF